jgi:hypothetical protein
VNSNLNLFRSPMHLLLSLLNPAKFLCLFHMHHLKAPFIKFMCFKMGKFSTAHYYFFGICRNILFDCVFVRYHYNFVTHLPKHTAVPKTESLAILFAIIGFGKKV